MLDNHLISVYNKLDIIYNKIWIYIFSEDTMIVKLLDEPNIVYEAAMLLYDEANNIS